MILWALLRTWVPILLVIAAILALVWFGTAVLYTLPDLL